MVDSQDSIKCEFSVPPLPTTQLQLISSKRTEIELYDIPYLIFSPAPSSNRRERGGDRPGGSDRDRDRDRDIIHFFFSPRTRIAIISEPCRRCAE